MQQKVGPCTAFADPDYSAIAFVSATLKPRFLEVACEHMVTIAPPSVYKLGIDLSPRFTDP